MLRVAGRGAVTIFDPAAHGDQRLRGEAVRPLLASGVVLHVLPAGAAFDLTNRPWSPQAAEVAPEDAAEIAEAQRDMRQLARDIAAGGRLAPAPSAPAGWPATRPSRPQRPRRPPGRRPHMSERPTPDLQILETRVYRGANVWSYDKAIHLVVDLGSLEQFPTNTLPGFTDELLVDAARAARPLLLPRASRRLRRAAQRGHLAGPRRRARRARAPAGRRPRHPPRQDPRGEGPDGRLQRHLRLHRRAGRPAAGKLAVRLVNHLVQARPRLRLGRRARAVHPHAPSGRPSAPRRRRSSTRPSPATSRGSASTRTPWCSSARASTPSASGPR